MALVFNIPGVSCFHLCLRCSQSTPATIPLSLSNTPSTTMQIPLLAVTTIGFSIAPSRWRCCTSGVSPSPCANDLHQSQSSLIQRRAYFLAAQVPARICICNINFLRILQIHSAGFWRDLWGWPRRSSAAAVAEGE